MLTQEKLKKHLEYNPDTGVWRWLYPLTPSVKVGQIAGSIRPDGYRQIRLCGSYYFGARLVWLYMTGQWPTEQIDHINRDRADDRWCNLRAASASDNNANRKLQANNTSGFRGVSWDQSNKKWDVRVNRTHVGFYSDLDEAVAARDEFAMIWQGQFAVLNNPQHEEATS